MATTELNLTMKIEGLEELQKLVELVSLLNEQSIKISVSAGLSKEN